MLSKSSLIIQNTPVIGKGEIFCRYSPKDEQLLYELNQASISQVSYAIKTAKEAQKDWQKIGVKSREELLMKYAIKIKENADFISQLISQETGKPLWESKQEVKSMINKVSISCKAYKTRCKQVNQKNNNIKIHTRYKALGLIAVLGPYNFPGHIPLGHIIPALISGNTVVFKPSQYCMKTGFELIKLWVDCNSPPSIINVLQGDERIGHSLVTHPDIDAVFFTGSEKNGRDIARFHAMNYEKILALELGGNNPIILHDTKQAKHAINIIIESAFISAGQRCSCARRLIICKNKDNQILFKELVKKVKSIKISKEEGFMGSLISMQAVNQALKQQSLLQNKGGKVFLEMKKKFKKGAYLSPGIMDVTNISQRPDEEIFAPLLQVIWVDSIEEAIYEANNTIYGLSASVITEKKSVFDEIFCKVDAGIINWNRPTTGACSSAPFGGVKASGNHRPAAYFMIDSCVTPIVSSTTKTCESTLNHHFFKQ